MLQSLTAGTRRWSSVGEPEMERVDTAVASEQELRVADLPEEGLRLLARLVARLISSFERDRSQLASEGERGVAFSLRMVDSG